MKEELSSLEGSDEGVVQSPMASFDSMIQLPIFIDDDPFEEAEEDEEEGKQGFRSERTRHVPRVEKFEHVTVIFADVVGFTSICKHISDAEIFCMCTQLWGLMDEIAEKHGLTRIKTIGDGYMAVCGVLSPIASKRENMACAARFALDCERDIRGRALTPDGEPLLLRYGIHSGSVVAGMASQRHDSAYDIWGNTVNIASRLESLSKPSQINTSLEVFESLQGQFEFEPRGRQMMKGHGWLETFFLKDELAS